MPSWKGENKTGIDYHFTPLISIDATDKSKIKISTNI